MIQSNVSLHAFFTDTSRKVATNMHVHAMIAVSFVAYINPRQRPVLMAQAELPCRLYRNADCSTQEVRSTNTVSWIKYRL
jgi:hypothetical protein